MILAAGAGRRMGRPKAQLEFEGETLLRRAVKVALASGCSPVIAVTNPEDSGQLGLEARCLPNPDAATGMASSIRIGITALEAGVEAVLLLTVDQPLVDAALLRDLQALFQKDPSRPAACAYAGTLGIPALFPRRLFPALLALEGDRGAKVILLREGAATLPFPGGGTDLDTPEDLERLRR
ncbi:nucleotidyltransferase family protein [Geothrix limicola]|uniref:nucleotidyltransferase family protein n=1 Tax=Geothrix limicola TaxID=2927978 RepID=UPI002557796D|nr:nucleotidyltransferase family protein [Geothrix limicola]